jgi:hypothetical protein
VNQSSTKRRVPQARPGCRAPLAFWDRVKFLVLLAVLIAWVTATKTKKEGRRKVKENKGINKKKRMKENEKQMPKKDK